MWAVQVNQYSHKLVATKTGQRVALAQRGFHALGQQNQQLVSGGVSMGVVDVFEAIQVQVHHRHRLAVPQALRQRLLQPVGQQHAVGQVGQRVIVSDVLQLPLVLLHRRDVGEQRHVVLNVTGLVTYSADGQHLGKHLAIFAAVPDFPTPVAFGLDGVPHVGIKLR